MPKLGLALAFCSALVFANRLHAQSEPDKPARVVGEEIGTKAAAAPAPAESGESAGAAAPLTQDQTDLINALKAIIAKIEANDPKSALAPTDAIQIGKALDKFAAAQAAASADAALIDAFIKLLETVKTGSPDQKRAFLNFPDAVNSKPAQIAKAIAELQTGTDSKQALDVTKTYLSGITNSDALTGDAGNSAAIDDIWVKTGQLYAKNPLLYVGKLRDDLTKELDANTDEVLKSARADKTVKEKFIALNTELQKIIGQSDYRVHIVAAAYGDRAELDHFVSGGRNHRAGRADRWCNATAAMRTKCERKSKCDSLGVMSSVMCGYDPAEFVSPRYKGVLVQYQCIRNSNASFWLVPPLNASAADPVRFTPDGGPNYAVFLTAPDQQLACEVQ